MTVRSPKHPTDRDSVDRGTVERDDRSAPPARKTPPKRSYTRRRAGTKTAPGQASVTLESSPEVDEQPGPKAAPTIVEMAVAAHREQARGSDSDLTPTMIDSSAFDDESGEAVSPELASFLDELERSRARSAPSSPPAPSGDFLKEPVSGPRPVAQSGPARTMQGGLSAWGSLEDSVPSLGDDETSQRFETATASDSGIAKTKQLSPVELEVEHVAHDPDSQSTLAGITPPQLDGLRRELSGQERGLPRWTLGAAVALFVAFAVVSALLVWAAA